MLISTNRIGWNQHPANNLIDLPVTIEKHEEVLKPKVAKD